MSELSYDSFEARGVEESANRYDHRGGLLHGPVPNAREAIAETEIVIRFTKGFPTATDMQKLHDAGFVDTGAVRNQGREFTGPRKSYRATKAS